jgi:SNF2 family DNA or RNA helicase
LNKHLYRRVLLVAPASLCLNWQRELERWAPDLVVRRVLGDAQDRAATYRLPIRVLIASYEQIRSDVHGFDASINFDLAILDEARGSRTPGRKQA